VIVISRLYYSLLFLLILLLLIVVSPLPVRADGGAPQLAYVARGGQGIGIIDIAQRRVTGTIAAAGNAHTVLLSPDGHALYVTQPIAGKVAVIAAKTGKTLCTADLPGQPSLLALSLDATVLYAAGQGDSSVRALDPATCAVKRSFATREPVYGLAVAASTAADATPSTPNQLWICGHTSLTIFDVNGHLLGSVPVAGGPQYISIPGGFTAYVTTRQGSVVAIDLNTRRVIRTLLSGGQFGPMDYDANTGEVYVPDKQHNLLDVLAPVTLSTAIMPREPARLLRLNSSPQAVAITSDGQLGFVALADGQVLMLDIPGRSVASSIAVAGAPQFIITGLYPPVNNPIVSAQQVTTPPQATSTNRVLLIIVAAAVGVLLLSALWLFGRRSARKRL
jgi:DNA-binding beta-propeller fold protein YncE